MDGIIRLTDSQHKSALNYFRFGSSARISRCAHILILLHRGWFYRNIMDAMMCGSDLIAVVKRSFLEHGLDCAVGIVEPPEVEPELTHTICQLVLDYTPQDYGYFRTRWSCEILSEVLFDHIRVTSSGETVRRWMHQLGFAWRRPRPIVGPSDPLYSEKMKRIRLIEYGGIFAKRSQETIDAKRWKNSQGLWNANEIEHAGDSLMWLRPSWYRIRYGMHCEMAQYTR